MAEYQRIDALEIENRLRAYLDALVKLAGGRLTVYRIARIVLDDMRATHTLEERARQTRVEKIIKAVADAHHVKRDATTDEISWPSSRMAAILRELKLIDEKDHDT